MSNIFLFIFLLLLSRKFHIFLYIVPAISVSNLVISIMDFHNKEERSHVQQKPHLANSEHPLPQAPHSFSTPCHPRASAVSQTTIHQPDETPNKSCYLIFPYLSPPSSFLTFAPHTYHYLVTVSMFTHSLTQKNSKIPVRTRQCARYAAVIFI